MLSRRSHISPGHAKPPRPQRRGHHAAGEPASVVLAFADQPRRGRQRLRRLEHAEDHSPLLKEILATAPSLEPGVDVRSAEDLRRRGPAALRQAIATLERLAADSEVVEYKRFVYRVAEAVARAHREGGVLGIGGTEISEAEQAVLDEITAIFDRVHYTG